jgi:hypothetical protein
MTPSKLLSPEAEMTIAFKFEPRDLWVGVFWDKHHEGLKIYFCPLPTLVAILTFPRKSNCHADGAAKCTFPNDYCEWAWGPCHEEMRKRHAEEQSR